MKVFFVVVVVAVAAVSAAAAVVVTSLRRRHRSLLRSCACTHKLRMRCSNVAFVLTVRPAVVCSHEPSIDYYLNHRYCEHQIKDAFNDILFCFQLL